MPVSEYQLDQYRMALGVQADASAETIKKAYLQKSYALIRSGAPPVEKTRLRAAHDALLAELDAADVREQAALRAQGARELQIAESARVAAAAEAEALRIDPEHGIWHPASFDSRLVNAVAPPAVIALAILVQQSFFGFFLQGFHVWIHEFGHATVAWFTGRRALPLPIGWTNIEPERSNFVYFGILFLLSLLLIAGIRERKIVPIVSALGLAATQFAMTWKMPEHTADLWNAFAGVGGEFYLSAAMMGLFYFRMPAKFRWGGCRYFFLFIGAASFFQTWTRWKAIRRGEEGIPYGSMVHGDEDAGGDMNILRDDYGWSQRDIVSSYNLLGDVCLLVLIALYLAFVLRADRVVARWLKREEA